MGKAWSNEVTGGSICDLQIGPSFFYAHFRIPPWWVFCTSATVTKKCFSWQYLLASALPCLISSSDAKCFRTRSGAKLADFCEVGPDAHRKTYLHLGDSFFHPFYTIAWPISATIFGHLRKPESRHATKEACSGLSLNSLPGGSQVMS